MRLFHHLTDRIGQAVVAIDVSYEDWPLHRFYFAADPAGLDRLLAVLRSRRDIVDVTIETPKPAESVAGLFACAAEGGFGAVMVAHQEHDRYAP